MVEIGKAGLLANLAPQGQRDRKNSAIKAKRAYIKCRKLADVKNVGDNLQLHRSKINSDLYRPLRKHCGKIVAVKVVTRVKVVTGGCAKRRLCKS